MKNKTKKFNLSKIRLIGAVSALAPAMLSTVSLSSCSKSFVDKVSDIPQWEKVQDCYNGSADITFKMKNDLSAGQNVKAVPIRTGGTEKMHVVIYDFHVLTTQNMRASVYMYCDDPNQEIQVNDYVEFKLNVICYNKEQQIWSQIIDGFKLTYKDDISMIHKVTFNPNFGGFQPIVVPVVNGQQVKAPEFSDNNRVIQYWSLFERFELDYNFNSKVRSDFTLYASWISKHITVKFDMGCAGGTAPDDIVIDYKSQIGNLPTPHQPEGYKFVGWKGFVNRFQEQEKIIQPTDILELDDVVFTAQWKRG